MKCAFCSKGRPQIRKETTSDLRGMERGHCRLLPTFYHPRTEDGQYENDQDQ
jgi:hypothetical protein